MKGAGQTIRRLTLLRDCLQKERDSADKWREWARDQNPPDKDAEELHRRRVAVLDVEIQKIGTTAAMLTTIWGNGWLNKSADQVAGAIVRQADRR